MIKNNKIGTLPGTTGNYKLSFEIVPRGVTDDYGNILHFTSGDDCCAFGTRSPLISFLKGTTRLHCRMGDSTVPNWGFDIQTKVFLLMSVPRLHLSATDLM